MTFAIAASEKASRDYGNYLTSQVAFTFGQSQNKKANTVRERGRVRRTSKPLWDDPMRIQTESRRPYINKPNKTITSSSNVER